MREHEYEPTLGLPEKLPRGEFILWQASPEWAAFALQAFRIQLLGCYFAIILAIRLFLEVEGGASVAESIYGSLPLLLTAAALLLVLVLIGRLAARSTVYTVTNRRIVMRVGIALPMTINIPFAAVATMALRQRRDGSGDIILSLLPGHRVAWLALWPHCRDLKLARPEPMLRGLRAAPAAAKILSEALEKATTDGATSISTEVGGRIGLDAAVVSA